MRLQIGVIGPIGLGAALVGCRDSEPTWAPVTESEARIRLEQVYEAARLGSLVTRCKELAGKDPPICANLLLSHGVPPPGRPEIIGSRYTETSGIVRPGWILTVCGPRPDGTVYLSEFVVYRRDDGGLDAAHPAYWSGMLIADGREQFQPQDPRATSCPAPQ
ncbi:MAG: hypothetical protein ACKVVT_02340 [Dehalococcoidia bacterium]